MASTAQWGLIAEDVAEVTPALVAHDAKGQPDSVHYEMVNAMLLNEFLKEHKAFVEEQRKVQEQGATITWLKQQIEAVTAGLQKVSAQLELSKSATGRIRRSGPALKTATIRVVDAHRNEGKPQAI